MPTDHSHRMQSPRRRLGPALGLFLLAPLVGEFLLGNLPITWLWTLLTLAPLYGGGALIIREIARRAGLGWPGIVVLGLGFGVIEEAFVTQSLFNPDYVGLRLLDFGYLPALGMGAWWTVFVLGLHTVWSTAVPIALVETLTRSARRAPWLGLTGLIVTAVVFIAGCVATALFQPPAEISGSVAQHSVSAVVVVALVALAWRIGRGKTPRPQTHDRPSPPSPLAVGTTALAAGSAFMGLAIVFDGIPAWANVGGMLLALGALATAMLLWSRRPGWSDSHQLAVAGGLLLTYAWYGFVQVPSVGEISPQTDLAGNIALSAVALGLLVIAAKRVTQDPPSAAANVV